jgi:hypothetical protein
MNAAKKTRVPILGGGFAGLPAAIHLDRTLARDPGIEITLINRDNFFLLTPMLHEVAASDLDLTNIVKPVRQLAQALNGTGAMIRFGHDVCGHRKYRGRSTAHIRPLARAKDGEPPPHLSEASLHALHRQHCTPATAHLG